MNLHADTQEPQAPDPGPLPPPTYVPEGPLKDDVLKKMSKADLIEAFKHLRAVGLDLQSQVHAYQTGSLGAVNHDMQIATRQLDEAQRQLRDERAMSTRERHARIQANLEANHLRREARLLRGELHRLDGILSLLLRGYENLLPREGV